MPLAGGMSATRSIQHQKTPSHQKASNGKDKDRRLSSVERHMSAEEQEAKWAQEEMGTNVLTRIRTPEWVEMLLAVTRISYLQYRIDEERGERSKDGYQNPYECCLKVVTSMKFEAIIAFAILLNCAMIGWQASVVEGSLDEFFEAQEHFFIAFFLMEWCLRMLCFGWIWIFEAPNAADSFLVFGTGVIPKWILEPFGVDFGDLRILTCLRALRLVRIVRAVRLLPAFRELWLLMQGLIQSLRPLLWTGVIALMILYIFGVAATELIGRQVDYETDEYAQELFGDPVRSMFTMFQIMTMDSWSYSVARPIMKRHWHLCYFFVSFIMLGVFVFWNLITAVIVENAMSIAGDDDSSQKAKEIEDKKRELNTLANIFLEIDTDGSGELTTEEFSDALQNKQVRQLLNLYNIQEGELQEVWKVLDDGDGMLTISEFTNGMRRMKGDAKAKDVIDIIKKLRHTSLHHTELRAQVDQFRSTIGGLERDVERIQSDTGETLGLFQEMYHRLHAHLQKMEAEDRTQIARRRDPGHRLEADDESIDGELAEELEVEDLG